MDDKEKSVLIRAIRNKNNRYVQQVIEKGADVDVVLGDGYVTPLLLAAHENASEIVKTLVNAGADIDNKKQNAKLINKVKNAFSKNSSNKKIITTPLFESVYNESVDICKVLASAGANVNFTNTHGDTPLIHAIDKSNLELVKILIDAGADVNKSNKAGDYPLFFLFPRCQTSTTIAILDLLLEAGANVNKVDKRGNTALHLAASVYDEGAIKRLVEAGIEVDKKNKSGQTPLFFAAKNEFNIKSLLSLGAKVNMIDKNGDSPLHFGAIATDSGAVRVLIKSGADVTAKNKKGETPLHFAAMKECGYPVVEYLIKEGADVNATDCEGKTPAYVAAKKNRHLNVRILEEHGGNYGNNQKPEMEKLVPTRQCPICANTYTEDFFDQHTCA